MKNTPLFGIAAIIAATSLHQFPNAQAQDVGPNVSYGQNPIFMESGSYITTNSSITINAVQTPSDQDAVIVRIHVDCGGSTSYRTIQTSSGTVFYNASAANNTIDFTRLGIVLRNSESLDIQHQQYGSAVETCHWYALGYYTHS